MGSLVVWVMVWAKAGALGADDAPNVPSAPVQVGTSGIRHGRAEIGSWQNLILMFIAAIVIGMLVLLYAVRQRGKVLERRRLRRMAEAAQAEAEAQTQPQTHTVSTGFAISEGATSPPTRTTPAPPGRPAATA